MDDADSVHEFKEGLQVGRSPGSPESKKLPAREKAVLNRHSLFLRVGDSDHNVASAFA